MNLWQLSHGEMAHILKEECVHIKICVTPGKYVELPASMQPYVQLLTWWLPKGDFTISHLKYLKVTIINHSGDQSRD